MIKQVILFGLFFCIQSIALGEDLHLNKDQVFSIPERNLEHNNNDEYFYRINRLVLENGSVLVISDFFSNKKLTIVVNELVVNGKAIIIQPFSQNISTPFDFNYIYNPYDEKYGAFPKGRAGTPGPLVNPPAAGEIDNGISGLNGQDGGIGKNSVKLKLDFGILKLDELYIVIKSESGGNGGSGGKGQNGGGKRCPDRSAGNGGRGGNGGRAGIAGNINDIEFKWHELSPIITSNNEIPLGVSITAIPGISGLPGGGGAGGNGGQGGNCLINQKQDGSGGPSGSLGGYAQADVMAKFGYVGNFTFIKEMNK
jgi:hypothetical protein